MCACMVRESAEGFITVMRHSRMKKRCTQVLCMAMAFILFLLVADPVAATTISDLQKDIKNSQSQLNDVNKQIAGYKGYGTVLFSSHILESITLTSNRVFVLEKGRIWKRFEGGEISAANIRRALHYENDVSGFC